MNTLSLGRLVLSLRRNPLVQQLRPLLPQWLKAAAWRAAVQVDEIEVAGNRMRIPLKERNGSYYSDEYEPEVTAKLRELLKPGMTFCDVGANMGALTLLGARLVGPTGRVFAFEPFPENAEIMRENVTLNGFTNVTIVEAAVSDRNGEAELHLSKWCGSHGLAENPGASVNKSISVKTVRLDSVPGLLTIDLLKSDTEGTELAVLRGLGELKPKDIIIEANTNLFKEMGNPSAEFTGRGFLSSLRSLNLEIVQNLTDVGAGIKPLQNEEEGLWNLHLQPGGS